MTHLAPDRRTFASESAYVAAVVAYGHACNARSATHGGPQTARKGRTDPIHHVKPARAADPRATSGDGDAEWAARLADEPDSEEDW